MDFERTPGDELSNRSTGRDSRIQSGMSGSSSAFPESESARPTVAEVVPIRPGASTEEAEPVAHIPIWMQRANMVMKFLICVWIGMILTVLPWTMAWSDNSLILSLPKLRALFTQPFVRGMISGVGLVDIWIGIWEAVHYHDQRPAPKA